ncbi:MAG: glycoside hydrolase family 99-like domain-containing protein [Pseudomonadota bacterium]
MSAALRNVDELSAISNTAIFDPTPEAELEGYVPLSAKSPPENLDARAIAFYLPQFHPIPENDRWWGKGFTEWTKVKPAIPQFTGHDQPKRPGELGYYDLLEDPTVMRRQAELAELHGLSGFCFYFYWFAGKRLLEAPIQRWREDQAINFPYCLCWANENWTRRWDGRNDDILIEQDHSAEDDKAFIEYVSKYLNDSNYIRIGGKPLLIVYRPSLLPNASETANRWRKWCRENGIGEIFLAYTQSFERDDPSLYNFDAAIEFPPNNSGIVPDSNLVPGLSDDSELAIYDWRKIAGIGVSKRKESYRLIRGLTPSWDNTARRPRDGAVFVHSSPSTYKRWLEKVISDLKSSEPDLDQRLVFINAWNEWAEGAYLEPDESRGYAYLEATRRALIATDKSDRSRVIVVTHDLHRHGAQYLSLNILRALKQGYGFDIASISGEDGALANDFREQGRLEILDPNHLSADEIRVRVHHLASLGYSAAIVNSSASGWIAPILASEGIRLVGNVHELPSIINSMKLEANLIALNKHAKFVNFASPIVRDQSAKAIGLTNWNNPKILPQGLYSPGFIGSAVNKKIARGDVIERLQIRHENVNFVIGVGYGDRRKGIDTFLNWADAAMDRWVNVHFIWLGKLDAEMTAARDKVTGQLPKSKMDRLHFPGFVEDVAIFYQAATLYALTSREDPFPSSALEALSAAAPVIMISKTGGIESLADGKSVIALANDSSDEFLKAAAKYINHDEAAFAAGSLGRDMVAAELGMNSYVGELARQLDLDAPKISVVVPNYNYARHLAQRLGSIIAQSLTPYEIIFLDDASTDESIATARQILENARVNWRIIENSENSGDVFTQWRKGVEIASGDLVWIAEADDWADTHFLQTTVAAFERPEVVMSFSESKQVNERGEETAASYYDYVSDISEIKWTQSFVGDGQSEILSGLSIKNTIPNVSAVVFRKEVLQKVLDEQKTEITQYRVAGDWYIYTQILKLGALAFHSAALNCHRRHDSSVTISRFGIAELAEIARMQCYIANEFSGDRELKERQSAYLNALIEHFDLKTKFSEESIAAAIEGTATG